MKILTRKEYLRRRRWGHGFLFAIRTLFNNPYISHWKYQEKRRGWKAKAIIDTDIIDNIDIYKVMDAEVWCDNNLDHDRFFQGWANDQYLWAFKSKEDALKFKLVWG